MTLLVAIAAVVVAYVAFLWSLPCFPTTDGPVHMYYVHVLSALLAHSNPVYEHYFHIRHILPPYSLYYYALLLLSKIMPVLTADKVIISCYFVSFVFGFRYLARALGPSADFATLLASLLLLNWPLGMGFVNFCLSLSFSFWATGVWLRIVGSQRIAARIGFLAMVTAVMLTHPVPLLLLLIVTGCILATRFVHAWNRRATTSGTTHHLPPHWLADTLTLVLASLNLGYVKLFTVANPLKQVSEPVGPHQTYLAGLSSRIWIYTREHALTPLLGRQPDLLIYRAGLMLVLIIPVAMAIRQRLRNRRAGVWTAADTFLLLGIAIFMGLPFIPSQLNGLYYFADRLVICVWLAFLFAAAGSSTAAGNDVFAPLTSDGGQRQPLLGERRPDYSYVGILAFVTITTAALLHGANRALRPAARVIAAIDQQPVTLRNQLGFVMEDGREPANDHAGLSWNPYYWASVHIVRRNDAVLANAPWMDETIIPVAPSNELPEVWIKTLQHPFPSEMEVAFRKAPGDLKKTLEATSFFVVNQHNRTPLVSPDPLLTLDPAAMDDWTCRTGLEIWYRLCRRSYRLNGRDGKLGTIPNP